MGALGSVPRCGDGCDDFVSARKMTLAAAGDNPVAKLDLENAALAGHEIRLQCQVLAQRCGSLFRALLVAAGTAVDDRHIRHLVLLKPQAADAPLRCLRSSRRPSGRSPQGDPPGEN